MSDYIPQELWPEIFKKSTPETLIRCRCVCKSWRSFISSPSFIATHLAAQKPHLLARELATNSQQEQYLLFRRQTLPYVDLCFGPKPHPNFYIIGTVNGVICLADHVLGMTDTILLWNPLIRKCVYPPTPIYSSSTITYTSTLGFGFDPCNKDLKIARVACMLGNGIFGRRGQSPSKAEVFSVRDWTWRPVHYDFADCYTFQNRWSQCLLNGAVHWAAYLRRRRDVLLSFHFEREEFKLIELPQELSRAQVHVSKFGPMLSVLNYKHTFKVPGAHGCDIWAMQEYGVVSSWSMMVSVSWEGGGLRNILWMREDGGEMIVSTENEELLSFDPTNQHAKLLDIQCKGDGCFADDFVASLVLLDVKDWDKENGAQ